MLLLATTSCIPCLKTFLLLHILILPIIVQPLSFNITNFNDTESTNLIFGGESRIIIQNGTIVLNSDIGNGVGRATYGQPLCFKNSSNGHVTDFSTRFSFTIDVSNKTFFGDGFAFYVAPHPYQIPLNSGGGRLGLYDDNAPAPHSNIVAVEFDTYVNRYVDPNMRHVGINNNSAMSLAYDRFDIESNIGKMGHALITYNASAKLLSVSWFFEGTSSGFTPNANSLSYRIDLGEALPEWVTIGFSGATGSLKEENVIHSWEFSSTMNSMHSEVSNENDDRIMVKYKFQVKAVVVAVMTTCVFFVLVIIGVYWLIIKKRRSEDGYDLDRETIPRRFYYKELVAATNGFADDRKLGRGGSGQVYKGILSYLGRDVAVKRIFTNLENSERVFINEVRIISRLIHRNLVQFIGWCHEEGEFVLVFEYMPNGSLDTISLGRKKLWRGMYKVALSVTLALRYLHEDAEQCVLHRDIKSANVLLDTNFNTKLGDFGMAKLVDPRLRTQRTRVVGTYGYLAPEYINGGRASKESDIYSFGVLALEIACGRRTYKDGEFHVPLVKWVWQQYVGGNVLNVVDERLNKEFNVNEMTSLIIVGLWCTNPNDKERPKAAQVIKVLQLEAPLPVLPLDMHDRPPPSLAMHAQQPTNYSSQSLPFTNSIISVGR
ncbi:hypothetical protein JHK82_048550 [Glycine max]|uniref:non-specific serine/threonine protein kinase n=2 Tax=Glycine subgen. Soja TaxID=1462606 RepID=A0A0R0FH08_SOYBN|nr:hypothetical protein JHK82_048550 [Glycine max]RZB58138.1 L-type lectin-domain containing receptor kinase IX.1 [Glycine soja]